MTHPITRLIALAVMLVSIAGSGLVGTQIAASAGRHRLVYADTARDSDPPQVALGIAMGAFRGIFVNILWIRANDLKEQGKYYEAMELSKAITTLQPRFPRVWSFLAWNMAYNISVATYTPEERYRWVDAGVRLLRDQGVVYNPNDLQIHKELAWIYNHKIGGFTDDANGYYKRKVAEEWTILVGQPPRLGLADDIDLAKEIYAAWLSDIAESPDTMNGLIDRFPRVQELLDSLTLDNRPGTEPFRFIRRYTYVGFVKDSPRRGRIEQILTDNQRELLEVMDTGAYDTELAALAAHLRKRILIDDYNMEPSRMIRYTRKYGPIDWRNPGAHALYWAARGVENAMLRATDENIDGFDFVNTDRIVLQGIQLLYRYGDLYFDFLDYATGNERAYYQGLTNPYFVETYGELADEIMARGGKFTDQSRRPWTIYGAGLENFMRDAVRFFYRRGQIEKAEEFQYRLRTNPLRNMNDPDFEQRVTLPVDEFVRRELFDDDRITSPYVMASEFSGSLQGAFAQGLLGGDQGVFRSSFDYAKMVHRYFFEDQFRELRDAGGAARLELVDRDFFFAAGVEFAQFVSRLSLDDAETVYDNAPTILQLYGYRPLEERFRPGIDEDGSPYARKFDQIFIQPQGLAQFEVELQAKLAERRQRGPQGIQNR